MIDTPSPAWANLNVLWAQAIAETLVLGGVRRVVVSPGSRSTPLALAVYDHAGLSVLVHPDERSAAFFAMGQAIASGEAVALVCTSGTAAANYLPAVIEASQARVPLVVLTADRPPALRQVGAAQTIDQGWLYGSAVRRFQELPLPAMSPAALRALVAQVAIAVATAQSAPAGPVHLNVPFEEPLAPLPRDVEAVAALAATLRPAPRYSGAPPRAEHAALAELAGRLDRAERPLIVAGPGARDSGGPALLGWAAAAGIPVVADVGSDLRGAPHHGALVLAHADAFLRRPDFLGLSPDLVIRVGGPPTGKGIASYLEAHRAPSVGLQGDWQGRDPECQADWVIVGEVGDAARRLAALARGEAPAAWRARWAASEADVASRIATSPSVPAEARALLAAAAALPDGGRLCLSNSLPVRHAETYWGVDAARGCHAHAFRGANGIDGVTSAALGIALASQAPTLLVTGDLACLHDLGGLQAARYLETPVAILVLNNDGGGIFSYLPVAEATPAFEPLFGTPHGLAFSHAAALFGLAYTRCEAPGEVAEATRRALATPGVSFIEFVAHRSETVAAHRAFLAEVAAASAPDDGLPRLAPGVAG